MPAIFAHYFCGEKAIKRMDKHTRELYEQNWPMFRLGCQGPDILFYHNVEPWRKDYGLYQLGRSMHAKYIDRMVHSALSFIRRAPRAQQDGLVAYLAGYLCHYALDSTTHPYVYYVAKDSIHHIRLETMLDVMMREKRHLKPGQLTVGAIIALPAEEMKRVGELYSAVCKEVYEREIPPDYVVKALRDMNLSQRILRDPKGRKIKLVRGLERMLRRPEGDFTRIVYPLHPDEKYDYANLKNRPWKNPCDESIVKQDNFFELVEQAAQQAAELATMLYKVYNGDENEEALIQLVGHQSFNTGLPYEQGEEMKYFNVIFMD